ncbi:MAG: hypothetical protein KJ818_05145 [Candidatus Omnitrophica bacterium]|nr:hypothetical protein [Candidatus Omnitrophota bacterium]
MLENQAVPGEELANQVSDLIELLGNLVEKLKSEADSRDIDTDQALKLLEDFAPAHLKLLDGKKLEIEELNGVKEETRINDITGEEITVVQWLPYSDPQRLLMQVAAEIYERLVVSKGLEVKWIEAARKNLISVYNKEGSLEGDQDARREAFELFCEDYQALVLTHGVASHHWYNRSGFAPLETIRARRKFFQEHVFKDTELPQPVSLKDLESVLDALEGSLNTITEVNYKPVEPNVPSESKDKLKISPAPQSNPLSRNEQTFGYELNGQLNIDPVKARELFAQEFSDLAVALSEVFAKAKGKRVEELTEQEQKDLQKEIANKFTGFIHAHEIFHQLLGKLNLTTKNKEDLANIFAKILFGIASDAEIATIQTFINSLSDVALRNQLSTLINTRYDDATPEKSFLLALHELGIEFSENINTATIKGNKIPEGANPMERAGNAAVVAVGNVSSALQMAELTAKRPDIISLPFNVQEAVQKAKQEVAQINKRIKQLAGQDKFSEAREVVKHYYPNPAKALEGYLKQEHNQDKVDPKTVVKEFINELIAIGPQDGLQPFGLLGERFRLLTKQHILSINLPFANAPSIALTSAEERNIEMLTSALHRLVQIHNDDPIVKMLLTSTESVSVFIGARPAAWLDYAISEDIIEQLNAMTGKRFVFTDKRYLYEEEAARAMLRRGHAAGIISDNELSQAQTQEGLEQLVNNLGDRQGILLGYGLNNTSGFINAESVMQGIIRKGFDLGIISRDDEIYYSILLLAEYFHQHPQALTPEEREALRRKQLEELFSMQGKEFRGFNGGLEGRGEIGFSTFDVEETQLLISRYTAFFEYASSIWSTLEAVDPATMAKLASKAVNNAEGVQRVAIGQNLIALINEAQLISPEVLTGAQVFIVDDAALDELSLTGDAYGYEDKIFIRGSKAGNQSLVNKETNSITDFARLLIHELVARHLGQRQTIAENQGDVHHWAARNIEQQIEETILLRSNIDITQRHQENQQELQTIESEIANKQQQNIPQPIEDMAMEGSAQDKASQTSGQGFNQKELEKIQSLQEEFHRLSVALERQEWDNVESIGWKVIGLLRDESASPNLDKFFGQFRSKDMHGGINLDMPNLIGGVFGFIQLKDNGSPLGESEDSKEAEANLYLAITQAQKIIEERLSKQEQRENPSPAVGSLQPDQDFVETIEIAQEDWFRYYQAEPMVLNPIVLGGRRARNPEADTGNETVVSTPAPAGTTSLVFSDGRAISMGLGPCIGVIIHNPRTKKTYVGHSSGSFIKPVLDTIEYAKGDISPDEIDDFEVIIAGGGEDLQRSDDRSDENLLISAQRKVDNRQEVLRALAGDGGRGFKKEKLHQVFPAQLSVSIDLTFNSTDSRCAAKLLVPSLGVNPSAKTIKQHIEELRKKLGAAKSDSLERPLDGADEEFESVSEFNAQEVRGLDEEARFEYIFTKANRVRNDIVDWLNKRGLSGAKSLFSVDEPGTEAGLSEVIVNAFEAISSSDSGRGKVVVKAKQKDGKVILEVFDEGDGLTQEAWDNLFVRAYSSKEYGVGRGLLALGQRLVQGHLATIEVSSRRNGLLRGIIYDQNGRRNKPNDQLRKDLENYVTRFAVILPIPGNASEGQKSGDSKAPGGINSPAGTPGGIDFRGMPIMTQPVPSLGTVPLARPDIAMRGTVPMSAELKEIQAMIDAGITPSAERIREYLLSCCSKDSFAQEANNVLSCISDILRLEEEKCCATDSSIKEFLVLLESDKPAEELKLALANIDIAPQEPELVMQ